MKPFSPYVAALAGFCILVPSAVHAQTAVLVGAGLSAPVFATQAPGDASRLFIAEQGSGGTAQIRILDLATNTVLGTPFLTISGVQTGGEQGLLGLAFAPDYATSGKFFVDFTGPGTGGNTNTITIRQYFVSGNPNVANAASGVPILSVPHPQGNHNAGWIGFSPRSGDLGNLYISMGDGGSGNDSGTGHTDPGGNAQDPNSLLGKMLRININSDAFPADPERNYAIPANNPFAATAGADEIFALGLRNPFRASFDRQTGDLFIGDVGQGQFEEVDVQKASTPGGGDNFGWRLREGTSQTPGVGGEPPAGNVEPIVEYPQTVGRSVIGGFLYRGTGVASLTGKYIFGDYLGDNNAGDIFSLDYNGTVAANLQVITNTLFPAGGLSGPAAFAEDAAGELYIVTQGPPGQIGAGQIFKVVPEAGVTALWLVGAACFGLRRIRRRG